MTTGNVPAGKDHHHECAADGEWRNHARRAGHDRAADGEDEKECPDEFSEILVHSRLVWKFLDEMHSQARRNLTKFAANGHRTMVQSTHPWPLIEKRAHSCEQILMIAVSPTKLVELA